MSSPAVLVVGPSWVGDMVMAQSLFKWLAQSEPKPDIDVVAPAWSLPVLDRMPEVRRGVALPLGHGALGLGVRRRIGHSLRDAGYAQAIVLPRSAKAALLPWFAEIPKRTGYRGEMRFGLINDMRAFDRERLDQTVKRFLALGLPEDAALPAPPRPSLRIDRAARDAAAARLGLDLSRPAVGLLPGAEYGPAKCWPHAHFARLARLLVDAGYAVWLFGGPGDQAAAATISAQAEVPVADLTGQTSLTEAIDLLSLCGTVVTNDSGLMHVAAAVGCHTVALYGSTSPAFTPPLTDQHTIHDLELSCSPCFARECPLKHLDCLWQITPEAVLASVEAARA
ncbi:MAG: lipopolysaccharide heptosyltransferase II [Pseudomonadota bacterium]